MQVANPDMARSNSSPESGDAAVAIRSREHMAVGDTRPQGRPEASMRGRVHASTTIGGRPVAEPADVEVVLDTRRGLDLVWTALPAEEDASRRLHGLLSGHDPFALIGVGRGRSR